MAEVYEARRPGAHGFAKRVALKRILPQLSRDQRLVKMFCAEARIHAALTHPNLVSVLDFGEAAGELYLVMEYVDGVALSEVLRALVARKRAVELGPALHVAREVAAGLAYAHQLRDEEGSALGVVHRDVAPNNILLGRAGEVKLTDFGIVQSQWSEVRTSPDELRGRVGYISPEQAGGRGAEPRSDLFSLGVVLAEMLLGGSLIPGHSELEVLHNLHSRGWDRLESLASRAPAPVLALLHKLLAKSPRNRPANAALVVRELDQLASALGVRTSAHGLSLWLADSGVVRVDSDVRVTPRRAAPGETTVQGAPAVFRDEQPTIVDADALKPIVRASPGSLPDEALPGRARPSPGATPALRYRLRRPGGEVIGPLSLGSMLALLATARAGLDSELAREDGPFLKLSRAFELTRLATRPLYRFFDPVTLLASERYVVERASLPALLLRLALSRRTGLLVYRFASEQRRIYFENGVPAATASTDPTELLGQQLLRAGLLSEVDLERVLESGYRSGCQLGESLVRAQLISKQALGRAVVDQRVRRLTGLCRARAGELFFIDDARSEDQVLGLPEQPLAGLLQALEAAYPDQELERLLGGLERSTLKPAPNCVALRAALCLSGDQAYAFDLCLRGVKIGLVLREARARGEAALRAASLAIFLGLSAGAFVAA